uniref:Integrase catalytic domain-containing protein n=1 Tax=Cannabis sativa TaxID=3483 RepID=A0A803PU16_CANSA
AQIVAYEEYYPTGVSGYAIGAQLPRAALPANPQASGIQFSATLGYTQNLALAPAPPHLGAPVSNSPGINVQFPTQFAPATSMERVPQSSQSKRDNSQRDPSKRRDYHNNIGHTTNECKNLKDEIESLIRLGHLIYAGALKHDKEIRDVTELPAQRSSLMNQPITFIEEDAKPIWFPHHDPLVIKTQITNKVRARILVDNGSSVNLLFKDAFTAIGLTDRDLSPSSSQLTGFNETTLIPMGKVRLPVTLCPGTLQSTFKYCTFVVVDCPTAYNAILERPALVDFGAITSIRNSCLKFPTQEVGIGTVRAEQDELDPRVNFKASLKPMEDIEEGAIEKTFARPGESGCPTKGSGQNVVQRFIRDLYYPELLANPVLVPKPNGTRRVCIDFTDLNKACLKDCFLLPKIDQMVDATSRFKLLSFMDAYSGKLRPYFQAHSIKVFMNHPLRQVLQKPEALERLLKWAMELRPSDIQYILRISIKDQAPADLIVECNKTEAIANVPAQDVPTWKVYVDRASNENGSGAGIAMIFPDGLRLQAALRFTFLASNNEAEYEALIIGLKLAKAVGANKVERFANIPRALPNEITLMTSPWPFAVWEIDPIGSLPTGNGGVKYTIVAVYYYKKWTETEPMKTIIAKKAMDFIIKNIVCRYGLPHKIVSDNGKQFDCDEFTNFCNQHGVIKSFSAVARPQKMDRQKLSIRYSRSPLRKNSWLEKIVGLKNCRMYYGPTEPLQEPQPATPHSQWSTSAKPWSQ